MDLQSLLPPVTRLKAICFHKATHPKIFLFATYEELTPFTHPTLVYQLKYSTVYYLQY